MKSEIYKIIEGGIVGDRDRVVNYTKLLIKNLIEDGELKTAQRIEKILTQNNTKLVGLDSLHSKPVDQESRMEMVTVKIPTLTSEKVILNEYLRNEVNDFVSAYLKKDMLIELDIEITNKLLLYGKPGTGKATLANLISHELNLPLVTARLDGLVSSLLGSTAKNIRKIFDYAKKTPCVLFLDEFDVIAKVRDDKNELGELKRVVNSLLQNIDEFDKGSVLIAATNHENLLDPAVWRRFDKVIEMPIPNENEIIEIIKLYSKDFNNNFLEDSKKINNITKVLLGFSHSDIRMILKNAIRKAVLNEQKELTYAQFIYEIYVFNNHNVSDEEELIAFLLDNGVSQKDINSYFNIPLRKIRAISK